MNDFAKNDRNKTIIAVVAFLAIAVAMLVVSVLVVKCPIAAACVLLVLQVAIAGLLHNGELWLHGAFIIIEFIAGLITGKVLLVVLFVVVYLAATVALKFVK